MESIIDNEAYNSAYEYQSVYTLDIDNQYLELLDSGIETNSTANCA